MATVLIAGCGYVGTALGQMLVADGHQVFGLKRNPEDLPKGLKPIRADLALPETLVQLPNSIDYVFYTAGAGRADEESYRRSYLDGMGRLLSSLTDLGEKPRRMFFTSSTSVYDQRRGEWVDEDSHTAPSSSRGDMMLMTERLLLASSIPGTVVRFGGIYGPGRDQLVRGVLKGEIAVHPGEPHFTNRIHRDDAAGCLRHLMSHAGLEDIYLGVDHEAAEETVVLRWLADRLAVKLPEPEAGDSQARVRRTGSKRCRNQRLTATGYRFLYPTFREGYEMVIRDRNDGP
ncbi:MAG: SDR family oxidoreductase [Deltaproteobacteria bacterium]|nr:SDR family oxidoreductase [Deltaproteobacteria bacterium]